MDGVKAAAADVVNVPVERRPFTRWASLSDVSDPKERLSRYQTASYLCNSLSKNKLIVYPVLSADGLVIRLQLDDWEIDPKEFDRLVNEGSGDPKTASAEPYHYVAKVVVEDVYEDRRETYIQNGYQYERVVKTRTGTKRKSVLTPAPWILTDGGVTYAALANSVGSATPIVRCDWLLYNASLAPGYYRLLGIGDTLKDLEKFAFTDIRLAERARAQSKGVVVRSSVAQHPRGLLRSASLAVETGGYFWISEDYDNSRDENDPVRIPIGTKPQAFEVIWSLPNSLQGYAVFNGEGKRLDVAVIQIAADRETPLKNPEVWNSRNCMGCHAKGMRMFDDEIRGYVGANFASLANGDADSLRRLQALFTSNLRALLERDSANYAAAVKVTTGLEAQANGDQFTRIIFEYAEGANTLTSIAREAGVAPDELRGALVRVVGLEHPLAALVAGRNPRRDQLERALPQMYDALAKARN